MDYKEIINSKFRPWFSTHGQTHRALGYGGEKSQHVRFAQFNRYFNMDRRTVLDVGCGFGDFFHYCNSRDITIENYFGIDVVPEFIETARNADSAGQCQFLLADFLEWDQDVHEKFDYAIACAALNTTFKGRDDFAKLFIKKMWKHCDLGMAFSMENVHGLPEPVAEKNYDPAYWLDFVSREISHKLVLFSDYHDSDFTICVSKG